MRNSKIFDALDSLVNLFIPRRCGVCGDVLVRNERQLCTNCIQNMPLTRFWLEERNPMAERLNERIQERLVSDDIEGREPFSFALALYYYRENYRELSKKLKYKADIALGRYVAAALGRKAASCEFLNDVDLVVPVPLHRVRQLGRGYNQAEIIAEEVAEAMSVSVKKDILRRSRHTRTQTRLDGEAKKANVAGAFSSDLSGLACRPTHILIVDDVFTTGNTLCECHRALRQALIKRFGASEGTRVKISAATLAFVGE